jgi:hypothetical protein
MDDNHGILTRIDPDLRIVRTHLGSGRDGKDQKAHREEGCETIKANPAACLKHAAPVSANARCRERPNTGEY